MLARNHRGRSLELEGAPALPACFYGSNVCAASTREVHIMSSIRRLLVASLACFAIAQAAYSLQGAAQLSAPEVVTADAHRTSPGGATFTVPAGWSIAIGKNVMVVGPPETDTHIAIVN